MQGNKEKELGKSCTAKHVSRIETEGLLWMLMTNDVENVVNVCKRACMTMFLLCFVTKM